MSLIRPLVSAPEPLPSLDSREFGGSCPPTILSWAQGHNVDATQGFPQQLGENNEPRSAADPTDCKPCANRSLDALMVSPARRGQGSCTVSLCSPPSADNALSDVLASGCRRSYGCTQCEQQFGRQSALNGHLLTHGSGDQHYCDRCGAHFISLTLLGKHTATMHPRENTNERDRCEDIFVDRKSLDKQLVSRSSEKPHACAECGKKYSREICLRYHMRLHHDRGLHACEECGRRYDKMDKLRDHMRTHTGEKPYACGECNKRFALKEYLRYHMRIHAGNRPHKCHECERCFMRKSDLRYHMHTHTEVKPVHSDEWPHPCDECGRRFRFKSELKRHVMSHTDEKPYLCEVCGKGFRQWSTLEAHIMTAAADGKPGAACVGHGHGGTPFPRKTFAKSRRRLRSERLHACGDCGAAFPTWTKLREHARVHSDERPYVCDECGNRFKAKRSLKAHVLTHSGEKPYACGVCGASFVTTKRLKGHMVAHSSEKPHACTECGNRYKRLNSLKLHMRTHTGQARYVCSQCPQTFSWMRSLLRHRKRVHESTEPYARDVSMEARTQEHNVEHWMPPPVVETPHTSCESVMVFPKDEPADVSCSS